MKKKVIPVRNSLRVFYSDGTVETVSGSAPDIQERFVKLVSSFLPNYVDGFKEVQLIEHSGRVFKSYKQMI